MNTKVTFEHFTLPVMSDQEFKALGLDEIGYIKRYRVNDGIAWVLHAADGAAIAVQKDAHSAVNAAQAQDLAVATVH